MSNSKTSRRAVRLAVASAMAVMSANGTVYAQTAPAPITPVQAAPQETAMIRLIRGLISSGALAKDVGEALLAQAQTEAIAAEQTQRRAAAAAAATAPPVVADALQPQAGDVRVPYISETVRDEIRSELKGEVLAQAKAEGWASPNETPAWTRRVHLESDVRVRNESRLFSGDNSDIEIDWPQINEGAGYDTNLNTNLTLPPLTNTRQDRKNIWRIRARVGVLADVSERTHAGVRIATGSDTSPVSTNDTLGGGLKKKDIWVDQAWLSYDVTRWLTLTGGRFANPYRSTDLLFDEDLNFDGAAALINVHADSITYFGSLGYTPLEYSSNGFPTFSRSKMASENKTLLGAQLGLRWQMNGAHTLQAAAAYYDFQNISGRVSDPCALYAGETACSTDWSRPAFMQKGNSLMLLRNIALNPQDPASTRQPQYVGLASKFRVLDADLLWDLQLTHRYSLRLEADYIRNMAYNENDMWARAVVGIVNNFDGSGETNRAAFKSGGKAYMLRALVGVPGPRDQGDWNLQVGYKRIEPDAVPDGYNDSDFHLGGTNARGYFVTGSYAIDHNFWFTGRWMATKTVYGAPLSIDTLQLDFNTRF